MQYRYVFFDLDGTLLDTLADLQDSVNTVIARYGLPPITRSEAAHFLGNGAKHLVHCSLKDRVSPEQEELILDEYKAWYQDHCQIKTAPYPGIMELLANLKEAGCRMAVVSNKPDPAVRELNATFFGDLLETANIGDTEVDLQTAANAGLRCICVAWGFRSMEELRAADAGTIVTNASELERCIL